MKLLLADDDPLFCRLGEGILQSTWKSWRCRDGEEAWRLLCG